MLFRTLLYSSLAIFLLGSAVRISRWFTRRIGPEAHAVGLFTRIIAAATGIIGTFFSRRILLLPGAVMLDVLLLRRTFKESRARWLAHMLIFYGFIPLLLLHALERFITVPLSPEYYSTLNPWLFLRDFFGVMVLAGIAIAIYRRAVDRKHQRKTSSGDILALALLAGIILSGFLHEAARISSYSEYTAMVDEYVMGAEDDELLALESYWVAENGTVSPRVSPPFSTETLELGQLTHESYCMSCHAPNASAFAGFAAANAFGPAALFLDRIGFVNFLWYAHFIFCFAGLAYIPFGKMFHMVAAPVQFIAAAVTDETRGSVPNRATRMAMALDACTHCGACSMNCSARMAEVAMENRYILPSEKVAALKGLSSRRSWRLSEKFKAVSEGVYLCTNCERCTAGCPSGINLKELWSTAREELLRRFPEQPAILSPLSFIRGLNRDAIPADDYRRPLERTRHLLDDGPSPKTDQSIPILLNSHSSTEANDSQNHLDRSKNLKPPRFFLFSPGGEKAGMRGLQRQPGSPDNKSIPGDFAHCFECRNCTTICPVVGHYPSPEKSLGLLPHQIMAGLGLGLVETVGESKMIWDCLTCYQCQEFCPQKVLVCDIFFRLKNMGVQSV